MIVPPPYCPHCSEYVSRATLYRHRLKYYDHVPYQQMNNTWQTCTGGVSTKALSDGHAPVVDSSSGIRVRT